MRCAWQAYLNLLPFWMRPIVDKLGKDTLQELRLRIGIPPELVCNTSVAQIGQAVTKDDLAYCLNAASRYSPWAATTAAKGFLTAPGGHRIGICGTATVVNGEMTGISTPTSLCIRVSRDIPDIARNVNFINRSVLIIGKPGNGKTTLLRDLIRQVSDIGHHTVAVVDERGELFPIISDTYAFPCGAHVDVLTGCNKAAGIEAVLRTMGPSYIAVDEITAKIDCESLIHAGWCGVKLLATAHAGSKEDLFNRPIYRPLLESNLFDMLLVLQSDKTWTMERCAICS